MFFQNNQSSPGLFGLRPTKPAPLDGPQTQPISPMPAAKPMAPMEPQTQPTSPYSKMAQEIMKQKFNRRIPGNASRGGAIATGLGGILDNAVDGWASKKGFDV